MDSRPRKVKLFVDTADLTELRRWANNPLIEGATTNPSLMAKAGIRTYPDFIREVLAIFPAKPVSFEVVADDHPTMRAQARKLADFGENVYVKIPAFNSTGQSSMRMIANLSWEGIKVNCTAVMDAETIAQACRALDSNTPSILSVFCGRISDTMRKARAFMRYAVEHAADTRIETLWASAREIYNVAEADQAGCAIITLFPAFLEKLTLQGKDLLEYEIETSRQFVQDAVKSGITL